MRHISYLWVSSVIFGLSSPVLANEHISTTTTAVDPSSWKSLKQLDAKSFAVNAQATQSEVEKDPLQPLNRSIYAFNDTVDRYVARPIALQYQEKVPADVRGSYRQFRNNLNEPWNAVNQLLQGKPLVATKTLGRFTINTLTSLGFADPAKRLGLVAEEESFATTLGYYGVPSGPYLVLPFLGPSTLRNTIGLIPDSQARLQKYMLDDHEAWYWSDLGIGAIDARTQLLSLEDLLHGDKYAAIRDAYLQRQNFIISQKQGKSETFEEIEFDYDAE